MHEKMKYPDGSSSFRQLVSVITPAHNEAANLALLFSRLKKSLDATGFDWEWILVDDASIDDTFPVFRKLAAEDQRLRGCRFSRNFGSHRAIACGLNNAPGNCAIVLAADLQDPPEEIPRLLEEWEKGAQIVWAVRGKREGHIGKDKLFSKIYYKLMRYSLAMKNLPPTGADFFLLDRRVIVAFNEFGENNVSIFSLLSWMGFRQKSILYDKQSRRFGKSGWTFKKKIKLVVDTITSFTYFPIRLMTYTGFLFALIGFCYLAVVLFNALRGVPPQGWSSLMTVLLVVSGIMMFMLGVLGEYLWRALDEARHRPRYLIEDSLNMSQSETVDAGNNCHADRAERYCPPL